MPHPPATEVARIRLPLDAVALAALIGALQGAYGPGLLLAGRGAWAVLVTPDPDAPALPLDAEPDPAGEAPPAAP